MPLQRKRSIALTRRKLSYTGKSRHGKDHTGEDITRKFAVVDSKTEMREILSSVYNSLKVKGYDPINQLVGYILSEDPTYITNYNNARSLICRIDRDELLHELLTDYLGGE